MDNGGGRPCGPARPGFGALEQSFLPSQPGARCRRGRPTIRLARCPPLTQGRPPSVRPLRCKPAGLLGLRSNPTRPAAPVREWPAHSRPRRPPVGRPTGPAAVPVLGTGAQGTGGGRPPSPTASRAGWSLAPLRQQSQDRRMPAVHPALGLFATVPGASPWARTPGRSLFRRSSWRSLPDAQRLHQAFSEVRSAVSRSAHALRAIPHRPLGRGVRRLRRRPRWGAPSPYGPPGRPTSGSPGRGRDPMACAMGQRYVSRPRTTRRLLPRRRSPRSGPGPPTGRCHPGIRR